MRFAVPGIVASAYVPPATFNELNSSWLSAKPTEWTEESGTHVYSATGTYNTDHMSFGSVRVGVSSITSGTLIVAGLTNNLTDNYLSLALGNARLQIILQTTGPVITTEWFFDVESGVISNAVSASDQFALAMTYDDSAGTVDWYYIDAGGTLTGSDTFTPVGTCLGCSIALQMFTSSDSGSTFGTDGDLRTTHTYFKVNDVLSQGAIEAIVSAWGI